MAVASARLPELVLRPRAIDDSGLEALLAAAAHASPGVSLARSLQTTLPELCEPADAERCASPRASPLLSRSNSAEALPALAAHADEAVNKSEQVRSDAKKARKALWQLRQGKGRRASRERHAALRCWRHACARPAAATWVAWTRARAPRGPQRCGPPSAAAAAAVSALRT
jgi:hypothetical protein